MRCLALEVLWVMIGTAPAYAGRPDPGNLASSDSVKLASFTATLEASDVLVAWQTGNDSNALGFYVYRQDGSAPRVQLNTDLILGSALNGSDTSYSWVDTLTGWDGAVSYWLEYKMLDGTSTLYGPVFPSATPPDGPQPGVIADSDGGVANSDGSTNRSKAKGGCSLASGNYLEGFFLLPLFLMAVTAIAKQARKSTGGGA